MTLAETLKDLEALGTEQNRKIYKRHGSPDNLYGVSFAALAKLQKKIRVDHALAKKLWATGNTDARTLATMIADPQAMTSRSLDAWLKGLRYYMLVDLVASVASRTAFAPKKMEQWTRSKNEWIGRAGWNLLARLAMKDGARPDAYFEPFVAQIARNIHKAKNRTRDAMNNALISIGIRGPGLEQKALEAARRIGKVEVDHGQTGCKTPDAASYILKAKARKRGRRGRAR